MTLLEKTLLEHQSTFHQVINFNAAIDRLLLMDFSATNTALTDELVKDTNRFAAYIHTTLQSGRYTFGIGGYNENRVLYRRSPLFQSKQQRSIHLGIDIWAPAGTGVYVPLGGIVHSFAFNNNFGDYGATIILQHQLNGLVFYTLYGHLSLADLSTLQKGTYMSRGILLAHVGEPSDNGDWPPHLHFQVIRDLQLHEGDYPGVCTLAEREQYLHNCPNPDLILQMMNEAAPV